MSAAGFGVSDFVGGIASRRVAALRVVLVSYPVAMVLLTIIAVAVGGHVSPPAVGWGALCGVSQAFGVWWFYAAIAAGPISVVSPVTAVLVAGVPIGVGVALGERPQALAALGIGLAIPAIVLVSRQSPTAARTAQRLGPRVLWLTVGSGMAFGLNFVVIAQAPVDAGLWPLVFARVSATVLVVLIAALTGNLALPSGVPRRLALLAGVLDTVANVAMLLALRESLLSVTSVLIALYPAGTVGLALVLLRERVNRWQVSGMVLALTAVALITAA